ncbi:response regulator transcription factor [Streptomyces sp. URMC 125]|uniref:response regulator transcription factor n=1 Tax=Streptomyces sp. URMC 125 TaxID=3423419 RepID=UPI003F195A03
MGEGLTNRQIARRLGVSPHTVNYHLRKLFHSYGVRSRIDLLRAVEQQRGTSLRATG